MALKNSFEVLFDGYSRKDNNGKMFANASCILIRGKNVVVIVDTMTAWDKVALLDALRKRDLTSQEITHVVCTHGHSDHIGNLNLFLNAIHIVGNCVSQKDVYFLNAFQGDSYEIDDGIEVIHTPGHTLADVSVIVRNTILGTVAAAGDLFEKEEDIENSTIWKEAGSENQELQMKHRERILNMAHYIVPGHGPMFKVTDYLRKLHNIKNNSL